MMRWHTTMVLVIAVCGIPNAALALECGPLKPNTPVDTVVETHFKGGANIFFRALGSGELEGRYKKVQKDVLSQYPNADELHIWKSYIYMLCTFLASSRLEDDERFQKFQWLVDKWRQQPPTGKSGITVEKLLTNLEEALKSDNPIKRRTALMDALGSGDADLQYFALAQILSERKILAIDSTWKNLGRKTALLLIERFDRRSGAITGTLSGSDIQAHNRRGGTFIGQLSGTNLAGSNKQCTINTSLKPNYRMEGYLRCGIQGGPATIPLR